MADCKDIVPNICGGKMAVKYPKACEIEHDAIVCLSETCSSVVACDESDNG